jgi:hypothetical protein
VITRARLRIAQRTPWLGLPLLGVCIGAACGSDDEPKESARNASSAAAGGGGSGGATAAGAAGMGGHETSATGPAATTSGSSGSSSSGGYAACVGCGEYLTTSDAMAQLCAGAVPLWEKWMSCACVACAQTCGARCELPPNPGCSTCRVEVAYGACAQPYQACANDL